MKLNEMKIRERKSTKLIYLLIFLVIFVQIISIFFVNKSLSKLDNSINVVKEDLKDYVDNATGRIEEENYRNLINIASSINDIERQLDIFKGEVNILKSSEGDFSGVIEDSVKSVVAVIVDGSSGSGFFITNDGYIVTNEHVVEDSTEVEIMTYDRKRYSAEVIGLDERKDIALLKVNAEYDFLELADSDKLQVGRKVIAIGNPLGLSFSVTEGIVSAVNRRGPNGLNEYIQTDVSLNPGNSGGPLIDTSGRVVGMNNFKIGGAESLGFALESNSIKEGINIIANTTLVE